MFKLPLLWKFHVASLSKKKSTTTTKTPNELETESLSFQKYEISENIQYNKFFFSFLSPPLNSFSYITWFPVP